MADVTKDLGCQLVTAAHNLLELAEKFGDRPERAAAETLIRLMQDSPRMAKIMYDQEMGTR
jgi:hypothetical protein